MNDEILVVGAINVDLVVQVDVLPGPGETVVGPDLTRHGGGKGANAAVAAARAGARVRLIGAVGDDDLGRRAVAELHDEGVIVDDVAVLEGASSGVALIVVAANGDNQIAVAAGANRYVGPDTVRQAIARARGRVRCVIVSTEINVSAVVAAVESATAAGITCLLDPAPVIPELTPLLGCGPILTPNAHECRALAGTIGHRGATGAGGAALRRAALAVAARTGAPVVVTLGGDGALVVRDDRIDAVAPRPATAVDTTGAGDTFVGVLGTWLGGGESLDAAVRAGTVAASLSVGSAGARDGMPSAARIDEEFEKMAVLRDRPPPSTHPT